MSERGPKARTATKVGTPSAKPRSARAVAPAPRKKVVTSAPVPKAGRMTAVGTALVGARRGDAEALIEAGRTSARGIQVVLQRCNAIVSETRAELRGVAQLMRAIGARKSVTELDKLALALVVLSIDSVRELAAIASATQREALDILAGRLQSDLKEFQAIRSRNKT